MMKEKDYRLKTEKINAPINPDVNSVIKTYPSYAREIFFQLRELLYQTATSNHKVGSLEETLKWNEPAYLTTQSKSGSTIRIAWNKKYPETLGIYLNCKTSLVENVRTMFPDDFKFEGNRGLILLHNKALPVASIRYCFEMALTYHLS